MCQGFHLITLKWGMHPTAAAIHYSSLAWDFTFTYLSKNRVMKAETPKQSGDNGRWCKHDSTDPNPIGDHSANVWKVAGSVNFECEQGPQVREWPQLAVEKLLCSKPLRNVGFTSQEPIGWRDFKKNVTTIWSLSLTWWALPFCILLVMKRDVRWKRCPELCIICPYVWNEDHSEGHMLVALWPTNFKKQDYGRLALNVVWYCCRQIFSNTTTKTQEQSQSQYIHQLVVLSWLRSVSKTSKKSKCCCQRHYRDAAPSTGLHSYMHPSSVNWTSHFFQQVVNPSWLDQDLDIKTEIMLGYWIGGIKCQVANNDR